MTSPAIDSAFVQQWAAMYSPTYDQHVLEDVSPAVRARGNYTREELLAVCRWKSPRVSGLVTRNSDADIEELTGVALGAPERLRHRVLTLLEGVGVPVASALLMVSDPESFTVIDFRSLHALRAHGELADDRPAYFPYVLRCREIAQRVGTTLRELDRALWQWSRAQGR